MKKLIAILLCLFILTACAVHKPVASPEEVNQYLDSLCYRSAAYGYCCAFEGVDKLEMCEKMARMLRKK